MIKKQILLVGNGNHQFITNYAYQLKNNFNGEISISILSYVPVTKDNLQYFDSIYTISTDGIFSKIKGIRRFYFLYQYKRLIEKLPYFDFVHFHFIGWYEIINIFKRRTKSKMIMSVWGSDMYKLKPSKETNFKEALLKADIITFSNQKSIDYLIEKFEWSKSNVELCRFGLAPLDNLMKLSATKLESKEFLGLSPKIVVTIGYNLSPAQQHLAILDQLSDPSFLKFVHEIVILLPITYGGNENYKAQLIKKVSALPFEYRIFDNYMTNEEVAHLRNSSDIMVQLQETDQFSGSMQEYLYTRNVVITGSWLPYETLQDNDVGFIEIDKMEELKSRLLDVLVNPHQYYSRTVNNQPAIRKLSSWAENIKSWRYLYSDEKND